MGLSLLNSSKITNVIALPNKFFDYVAAGLPALIGPSPSMAALIAQHGCGWVAPSCTPADAASVLARLTPDEIAAARDRTRLAAQQLNTAVEIPKLAHLFARLLEADTPEPLLVSA